MVHYKYNQISSVYLPVMFTSLNQFVLQVSSSNAHPMVSHNTSSEFMTGINHISLHPGEWEVACLGVKTPPAILPDPVPVTPFQITTDRPDNIKITFFTGYVDINKIKIRPHGIELVVDFSSILNRDFYTLQDLADALNHIMNMYVISYMDESFSIPCSFITVGNNRELGITFHEWNTDGVFQMDIHDPLAKILQFDFDGRGFGTGAKCCFILPGKKAPMSTIRVWYNVFPGYTYYTGNIETYPSVLPNAHFVNPMIKPPSPPTVRLLHILCDKIEDHLLPVQDSFRETKVLCVVPIVGAMDKMYFADNPQYHRLQKQPYVLEKMMFKVTDQNYNTIPFQQDQGSQYDSLTILLLHFRRVGMTFQGQTQQDVVHTSHLL